MKRISCHRLVRIGCLFVCLYAVYKLGQTSKICSKSSLASNILWPTKHGTSQQGFKAKTTPFQMKFDLVASSSNRNQIQSFFPPKFIYVYEPDVNADYMYFPEADINKYIRGLNRTHLIQQQHTCAVIGNSGLLENSNCGPQIEKHDFVFRSNIPVLSGFKKDVGSKVNFTSINMMVLKDLEEEINLNRIGRDQKSMKYYPRLTSFNNSIIWYSLKITKTTKRRLITLSRECQRLGLSIAVAYSTVPVRGITHEVWKLNVTDHLPSAGLMLFTVASTMCNRISMYGFFPFLEDTNGRKLKYHYFDTVRYNFSRNRHHMPEEYKVFLNLNKHRAIRLATTC